VFVLSSNHKGAIAEMKIATTAVELGIPILKPVQEHCRYDLGFEVGGRILRVQCKWGALDASGNGNQGQLRHLQPDLQPSPSQFLHRRRDRPAGGLLRGPRPVLPSAERVGLWATEVWLRLTPASNGASVH
jgi:hypothetical protein